MINVMIIEDDAMVRDINSKFLKKIEGFNLSNAVSNLVEAKETLKLYKPDLILLDLFLPKENGMDFLKWVRKEELKIDVILITADKSIDAVKEAFRYGAVDYLIKPFTFDRFKEALTNYRERFNSFNIFNTIEQNMLDKYISNTGHTENSSSLLSNSDLEKGLNQHTYDKIWNSIMNWSDEFFTAEELSENLGMARVTVRRYLEFMNREEKLDIVLEYGKVGRPQHKYKIRII